MSRLGFLRLWRRPVWRFAFLRKVLRETHPAKPFKPGEPSSRHCDASRWRGSRRWPGPRRRGVGESKAVPRVPTGKMVSLSLMLERAGHEDVIARTAVALDLHDYQYNGPDPDLALSKYTSRKSAAADVVELLRELAKRVETLRGRFKGVEELDRALGELRKALALWVT
jgi:hypothetical protein